MLFSSYSFVQRLCEKQYYALKLARGKHFDSERGTKSSIMATEARMLERRVSNNRADLNGDQQMNYFLAWFGQWSDLQKKDFVPVIASKMSHSELNGIDSLNLNDDKENGAKKASIYDCQVKLFRDWFGHWSDDQRTYLLMRLKDIDGEFYNKYEAHLAGEDSPEKAKDSFEPGVPAHLVRASRKDSTASSPNTSINGGKEASADDAKDVNGDHDQDDLDGEAVEQSVGSGGEPLSTIQEDE